MRILVANTTKQVQSFHYRVPESDRLMVINIPIGQQVPIYKANMSGPDADSIIEQLRAYGAVRTDEVDRAKPFVGLCFSIDKEVKPETIERVVGHNDDVLTKRGEEIRKQAAIGINEALDGGRGDVSGVTVSMKEDVKLGDPGLNETIEVVKEGSAPRPRGRQAA